MVNSIPAATNNEAASLIPTKDDSNRLSKTRERTVTVLSNIGKAVSVLSVIGAVAAAAFKFAPLWVPVMMGLVALGPIGWVAVAGLGAGIVIGSALLALGGHSALMRGISLSEAKNHDEENPPAASLAAAQLLEQKEEGFTSEERCTPITLSEDTLQRAKQSLDLNGFLDIPVSFSFSEHTRTLLERGLDSAEKDAQRDTVNRASDATLISLKKETDGDPSNVFMDRLNSDEFLTHGKDPRRINLMSAQSITHALIKDPARVLLNGKNEKDGESHLIQLTDSDLTYDRLSHDCTTDTTSYIIYCEEKLLPPPGYFSPKKTSEEKIAAAIYNKKTSEGLNYYRITATASWDFTTSTILNIEKFKEEEIPKKDKRPSELLTKDESERDLTADIQVLTQ